MRHQQNTPRAVKKCWRRTPAAPEISPGLRSAPEIESASPPSKPKSIAAQARAISAKRGGIQLWNAPGEGLSSGGFSQT